MKYERYASDAGSWLIEAARRKPEAFLVIAAGCALLMRSGSLSQSLRRENGVPDKPRRARSQSIYGEESAAYAGESESALSEAADQASGFVADLSESITEGVSAATDYAYEGGRQFTETVGRWGGRAQSTAGQMFHEQPIAVAALGLAAGAALAALLPRTELEDRALRPARDALAGAAGSAANAAKSAASDLATEGLQEVARGAVETFTSSMSGSEKGEARASGASSFERPSSPGGGNT